VNPLNPLYDAVAWVIMRIHSVVGAVVNPGSGLAWVLTLVILVVLMRLILLPLFIKQMHSTRKMSALAPQMQELRKKYKGDRQTLNEETMKLYRENGVNPLGGCLPLVAQLPLFFALFGVLRAISDWHPGLPLPYGLTEPIIQSALHADIFGATIADKFLFAPAGEPIQARIVILCAVIVSVVTTFLTVRQSTKRGMTPQMTPDNPMASSQKFMQYIVPLFALSGLYWAFGLVLYWMTTNIWTLGQQYMLFKRMPPLPTAATAGTGTAAAAGASRQLTGGTKRPSPKQPASGHKQVTPGGKPAGGSKPAAGAAKPAAKPATGAKHSGSNGAAPAAPAGQRKQPGNAQAKRPAAAAQGKSSGSGAAKPGQPKRPATSQAKPAGQNKGSGSPASTDGQTGSNGSGLLRRLGRRPEPEQEPETPEVKLVRQQRVRQSRSKRSGKR
jgi:YidC/Oxa1 family membrane protein insertase